jgi:5-(carboxyamino)imidazole ribonucleotide synthase
VITDQKNGVCSQVRGPAVQLGVDVSLEVKAREILSKTSDELDYVGVLAIEFFETESGELLINEMAPRVHNSGHYTLTSASTSQFESHVRAVMGLEFKAVHIKSKFGMANLVGPKGAQGASASWAPPADSGVFWYQKKVIRPGRKMGHVNFEFADTTGDAAICFELAKYIEAWEKSVQI